MEDAAARRSFLSHNVTMRLHTWSVQGISQERRRARHLYGQRSSALLHRSEWGHAMTCRPENLHDRIVAVVANRSCRLGWAGFDISGFSVHEKLRGLCAARSVIGGTPHTP